MTCWDSFRFQNCNVAASTIREHSFDVSAHKFDNIAREIQYLDTIPPEKIAKLERKIYSRKQPDSTHNTGNANVGTRAVNSAIDMLVMRETRTVARTIYRPTTVCTKWRTDFGDVSFPTSLLLGR